MKKYRYYTGIFGALALLNVVMLITRIRGGQAALYDFYARWQECAYWIHGIYPGDIEAVNQLHYIESIGYLDSYMVTVPWAWLLGMVINPGFLPYRAALIWGAVFAILTVLVTGYTVIKYFFSQDETIILSKKELFLLVLFIIIAQYPWTWAIMMGNQGALVCCFMVIAVCIHKKHPILAGILLTFTMLKPQVAIIFIFTFLFLGQWKVFVSALITGGMSYLIVCLRLDVGILKPILDSFSAGTELGSVFFGLFDLLKYLQVPVKAILGLDMLVGVIYVYSYIRLCRKYDVKDELSVYSGVAIASMFWFYKQPHDYIILLLPSFALLLSSFKLEKNKSTNYMELAVIIFMILIFYCQSILKKVACSFGMSAELAKEVVMTLSCFVYMLIGYYVIYSRRKISSK